MICFSILVSTNNLHNNPLLSVDITIESLFNLLSFLLFIQKNIVRSGIYVASKFNVLYICLICISRTILKVGM